ncbi:hypothetical protein ABVT39_017267 [Epinephelus coioides]
MCVMRSLVTRSPLLAAQLTAWSGGGGSGSLEPRCVQLLVRSGRVFKAASCEARIRWLFMFAVHAWHPCWVKLGSLNYGSFVIFIS